MVEKKFILQRLTGNSHAETLGSVLGKPNIEKILIGVAFVTESGVKLIERQLKHNAAKLQVFAGIRNSITSYQGLDRLLKVGGRVFTVDTGSQSIVFHPKLFLVRTVETATVVIGSANLTYGGLASNIEAGLAIEFNLESPGDKEAVDMIEEQFLLLETQHPKNVVELKSVLDIENLLAKRLIRDEALMLPAQAHVAIGDEAKASLVAPMKLKPSKLKNAKASFSTGLKLKQKSVNVVNEETDAEDLKARDFEIVWYSSPLKPSNINIKTSETAAPKNVLSLGQGGNKNFKDYQNYFRNGIFKELDWVPSDINGIEEANAKFEFILAGQSYGMFQLRIKYSIQTEDALKRKNVTTRLVWGKLLELVSSEANLGRIVYLGRDINDSKFFRLSIDEKID